MNSLLLFLQLLTQDTLSLASIECFRFLFFDFGSFLLSFTRSYFVGLGNRRSVFINHGFLVVNRLLDNFLASSKTTC